MTNQEAINILKDHQAWRRGDDSIKMVEPRILTQALDVVIGILEAGIGCACKSEDKHGETSIMCCNKCGKPTKKQQNL